MTIEITKLYRLRFKKDLEVKNKIWAVLCRDFFQRYIRSTDSVCDLGAGYCEFINNIKAKDKFAIDINSDTKKYAQNKTRVIVTSSTKLPNKLREKINVLFASNFFEHLPTKEDLAKTFIEIRKVLKPKGLIIILMPNIRYVGSKYWDFLDHQLPLSEKSMVEALELNGFQILELRRKFLPYSTKSSLPKGPIFVKLYLKLSFLHQIFGKQSLIVARKI